MLGARLEAVRNTQRVYTQAGATQLTKEGNLAVLLIVATCTKLVLVGEAIYPQLHQTPTP